MSTAPSPTPKPSFWHRRVREPLMALLTQGATPEKLAAAIAWSFVCSMFPFLGLNTFLNAGVGYWRKLNQPPMQALNYALSPLHLVMILVYVRFGETLWRAQGEPFSIVEMLRSFRDLGFGDFLQKFSWVGIHAFTAWLLTAPLVWVVVYYPARAALLRLARMRLSAQIPSAQ